MNAQIIYKICTAETWQHALQKGLLEGTERDLQDGYIHFSTREQLQDTLQKHYSGQSALFVLAVAVEPLAKTGDLKWEPARNGDMFPHLYTALPLMWVNEVHPVFATPEGGHTCPELGF